MEAARRLIGIALLWASSAGCSFRAVQGTSDGGVDAEIIPDASVCVDTSKSCAGATVLRDCQKVGELPVDTSCPWGCLDEATAHCGQLQPTGGVLTESDLAKDPRLSDRMATADGVINTEDGSITGLRSAGTGVRDGIDFETRNVAVPGGGTRSVGVFRFKDLTLIGNWTVTGANALAIASLGDVVLQGQLDLRGNCQSGNAGPGGTPGATDDAAEPGGGNGGAVGGTSNDTSGGGGGGYGASGGNGGRSGPGTGPGAGASWGDAAISVLAGGGGGGGGGGDGGIGGGGGGAVQIAANGTVSIRALAAPSGINAGGCGGKGGTNAGGGGGSGGAILIEAPAVELDGTYLVVNGGGGGGGSNTTATGNGGNGGWGTARASGGQKAGGNNGNGGLGGAAGMTNRQGQNGLDAGNGPAIEHAGGGGGGVGRIRVNTRTADGLTAKNGAVVSPTFEETGSTSTKAAASVR